MKTTYQARTVIGHTGESKAFTVKANGKAFRVLIDGLYADKISSITRELWSNALDSHVMNGCPEKPFSVSFPTIFDPTFRVRDYGISLSHDEVMNLYTTVFESTKEDTDSQVGKLGLGSKSPFAYTDSFSVAAILAGERRFYAAMIGADGIPTIHLMGAEPCDEEDGIEVSFPVDKDDLKTFQRAVIAVARAFDVKPTIINEEGFAGWAEDKPIRTGDGFRLYGYGSFVNGCYARMGCVLYPIDFDQVEDLSPVAQWLSNENAIIEFPIGTLEVTSSREALSYGRYDPTADSIRDRMNAIAARMEDDARNGLEACTTIWEARTYVNTYSQTTAPKPLVDKVRRMLWNGVIPGDGFRFDQYPGDGILINTFDLRSRKTGVTWTNKVEGIYIHPTKRSVIYMEDRTGERVKSVGPRIDGHLASFEADTRPHTVYWIRWHGERRDVPRFMDLLDEIDGAAVFNVDALDPPAPKERVKRAGVAVRTYRHGNFTNALHEDEIPKKGYWIPLLHSVPFQKSNLDVGDLRQSLARLDMLTDDAEVRDTAVLGAPKSRWAEFQDDPDWINIYDLACEKFPEVLAKTKAIRLKKHRHQQICRDFKTEFLAEHWHEAGIVCRDAIGAQLIDEFHRTAVTRQEDGRIEHARALARLLGRDDEIVFSRDQTLHLLALECQQRYPLIEPLSKIWRLEDPRKQIAEYINACDLAALHRETTSSPKPPERANHEIPLHRFLPLRLDLLQRSDAQYPRHPSHVRQTL